MRLAIAYNTMNKLELTKQTFPVLHDGQHALLWSDGSTDPEALAYFEEYCSYVTESYPNVRGGADAGIAHSLTRLLRHPANYTHVGLVEADVLLDSDWLEPTMSLFEKGNADGLSVGAVSPRSYVDRVLCQRDGYACMHNIGSGAIVFTREAAEIVLRTFRTGWWPDIVRLFAQLSGIDLRTYACFRGNEQWITTDWQFEAHLARHGLASLALTPAKASMIGQVPPLHEQGLRLTQGPVEERRNEEVFDKYLTRLFEIRNCGRSVEYPGVIHREGSGMLFFPHQMGALNAAWQGTLELKWSQGFGPFSYRAGPGGASLLVHVSSSCSFLVSGGAVGAIVTIEDQRSGFKASPNLPYEEGQPITVNVPGSPVPRLITMKMDEGAVFYGLSCTDPQLIDTTWKFDWSQLPEAK